MNILIGYRVCLKRWNKGKTPHGPQREIEKHTKNMDNSEGYKQE